MNMVLGFMLRMQGENRAAVQAYQEAIRLDPTLANAHASLGDLLRQEGRVEEAKKHHEHARRLKERKQRQDWRSSHRQIVPRRPEPPFKGVTNSD